MNLGLFEEHLLRALEPRLGRSVTLHPGPAHYGPASGVRAELFVHAQRFSDRDGRTDDGARVARRAVATAPGVSGFIEERPGVVEIEVTCVCARHAQAQALAGLVAPALLEALETLAPALLSDPGDRSRRLRFGDHEAHLHGVVSRRIEHDGVAAAAVTLTLRLEGFLQVQLARKGGLARTSPYAVALRLSLNADPAGADLQREYVEICNPTGAPVDLGGWTLQDTARRPHRLVIPAARTLAPGATLRVWSGRGSDDTANLYWGRRKAVWTNRGDVAILRDPDGIERARASWPPAPE